MKPKFSTLIVLIFLSAAILAPFAVSHLYEPVIRANSFDILLFVQGDLYKQITGYIALVFVILEMFLVARKRGRGWIVKLKIPGSILFWRKLHIFLGIGLLALVLIHTIGLNGLNFNAVFLMGIFCCQFISTGWRNSRNGYCRIISKKIFRLVIDQEDRGKEVAGVTNSTLIRNLRSFWLGTHIILVAIFFVMLVFHIFWLITISKRKILSIEIKVKKSFVKSDKVLVINFIFHL